jgi:hypothetical protein
MQFRIGMNCRTGGEILVLGQGSLFGKECNTFAVRRNVFPVPYLLNAINFAPVLLLLNSVTFTKTLRYV